MLVFEDDAVFPNDWIAQLEQLLHHEGRVGDTADLSPEVLEQLRELGYVR